MNFGLLSNLIKTAKRWNKISNLTCINTVRLNYLINLCKYKTDDDRWFIEAYVEDDNTGDELFVKTFSEGTIEYNFLDEVYTSVFSDANHVWSEYHLLKEAH